MSAPAPRRLARPDRTDPYQPFLDIVAAEMRRRAGDDSLRAYLDQLRADADVRLPAT